MWVIGILVYAVIVLAAPVDVAVAVASPEHSRLKWAIGVVALPVVGVLSWLAVGRWWFPAHGGTESHLSDDMPTWAVAPHITGDVGPPGVGEPGGGYAGGV